MAHDPIGKIAAELKVPRSHRGALLRELESHLEDSRRDLEYAGHTPEEARLEAARRFGDPVMVARMLSSVYRPRLRRLRVAIAASLLLGAASAGFGAAATFASSSHHTHVKPGPARLSHLAHPRLRMR